jgi:hypothetical protein
LLALFILFSLWGILRLACNSLVSVNACSDKPFSGGPYNNYEIVDPNTGRIVPGI